MQNIILTKFPAFKVKEVDLRTTQVLFDQGEAITKVYFPRGSIISLVLMMEDGISVETAMVGKDGMVGAAAALDGKASLNRAVVQISGPASMCEAIEVKNAAKFDPDFLSLLFRHEQALFAQSQQSAACNAQHQIEARLSRWMLRARDLSGKDMLPFTQEFLADMLGVSRPSVSLAAHKLQDVGLIKYSRGAIQIVNVEGLKDTACECYEAVQQHYRNLLGSNE
jgi:CRP-like cAMP-binding protein